MGAKVILFVLCATAVPARHLADVNKYSVQPLYSNPDYVESQNQEIVLETKPLYRSSINHQSPDRHSHRSHYRNQGDISENIDDYNNIANTFVYKLRTNAYTSEKVKSYHTTENVNLDKMVFINVDEEIYKQENNRNRGDTPLENPPGEKSNNTQHSQGSIDDKHIPITSKIDKNGMVYNHNDVKTNTELNNYHLSNQSDFTRQTGPLFVNNNNTKENVDVKRIVKPKINRPEESIENNLRANQSQIIRERSKVDRNDTMPKQNDSTEVPWIWGTEEDVDSLEDRAAFSGDGCPTGKAKVLGKCVDKQ